MYTNPMKRKIIYLILAYALLIMPTLWVKNYLLPSREKEYHEMREYGSFYENAGIYDLVHSYHLDLDQKECIRIAKKIEHLYKTAGPDSCRRFVEQRTRGQVFDRRFAWVNSYYDEIRRKDKNLDLIDSLAIVITP